MMKAPASSKFNVLYLILIVWVGMTLFDYARFQKKTETIPYSQFLSEVKNKQVNSVTISETQIQGVLKTVSKDHSQNFVTQKIEDPTLAQKLDENGVRFEGADTGGFLKGFFSFIFPFLLMMIFWTWLSRKAGRSQGELMSLGKSKARIYVETSLKTKFSDVAGAEEAKVELLEVVEFLKDRGKYGRLGGRMPKGLLLVGPPGTGKTLLARAVAGEAAVPFFSINGSEFVEMFVGLGAARVRDLFDQARKSAPCIIFIDELDALGKARGISAMNGGANDEKEQTLNQLLAELDGFDTSQGVVLLAATNRPEVLDPALLRSGRFDRQIAVDKPDRKGRIEILKIHLKKIQTKVDMNVDALAGITAGFSGADLENLVNEAALVATRRNGEKVESEDFTVAVERIVGGLERKSRILTKDEKRRVAYHEMGHATVSLALDQMETVHKVSIIPRGVGALGYTMRRPTEDRYLMSRSELERKLAVLLGGRAAETVFFKEASTGAADDLDRATEIARSMVTRYGMSESLGLLTYDEEISPLLYPGRVTRSHEFSESTAKLIDSETLTLITHAFQVALKTVRKNFRFIEIAARELLEKETLDEAALKALWETKSAPHLLVETRVISLEREKGTAPEGSRQNTQ